MEENKKDILKKGIISTDADFTSKLMTKINAEEAALSNVLSKHGTDATSPEFTSQLMNQLEGLSPKVPYEPAISKKAWIVIAAVSAGIIGLSVFYGGTSSNVLGFEIDFEFQSVSKAISSLFSNASAFYYVILGVLLLALGLFLERRVGKKV